MGSRVYGTILLLFLVVNGLDAFYGRRLQGCVGICKKAKMCPLIEQGNETCPDSCKTAKDCGKGQLCCSDGCGMTCMDGVQRTGLHIVKCAEICQHGRSLPKPAGVCPDVDAGNETAEDGDCANQCLTDDHCPGALLCCDSPCGKKCSKPKENAPEPGCAVAGKHYKHGKSFNFTRFVKCTCKKGRVTCHLGRPIWSRRH